MISLLDMLHQDQINNSLEISKDSLNEFQIKKEILSKLSKIETQEKCIENKLEEVKSTLQQKKFEEQKEELQTKRDKSKEKEESKNSITNSSEEDTISLNETSLSPNKQTKFDVLDQFMTPKNNDEMRQRSQSENVENLKNCKGNIEHVSKEI